MWVGGVMEIRELGPLDRTWSDALLGEHFGSAHVVSRGRLHDASTLPGLLALRAGLPVGLLQYHVDTSGCEIVALVVEFPREGIGTALLAAAGGVARSAGCPRLWLVTTNDNVIAQSFYASLGWKLAAVHPGAVDDSRLLKPEIPRFGVNGVAIQDELEYELDLPSGRV
jgi:ribosomal protein S18 acetylase RimI-like enzyme